MRWYWAQVAGNIYAIPLEALIGVVAGWLFRKPIGRLVAWLRREELAEAAKARKIAADPFEHQTGRRHELAPDAERKG